MPTPDKVVSRLCLGSHEIAQALSKLKRGPEGMRLNGHVCRVGLTILNSAWPLVYMKGKVNKRLDKCVGILLKLARDK